MKDEQPDKYGDIINLPRPASKRHPPMPLAKRAAQFSPFAALTGYEDAVRESARITLPPPNLADDEQELLDYTDNLRERTPEGVRMMADMVLAYNESNK